MKAAGKSAPVRVIPTSVPEVLILEPRVFEDARGFFLESYNRRSMEEAGISADFVQDNHSRSIKNVLRGLHYQVAQTQGKLIRAVYGGIFDVAVDLRRSSPTFGRAAWVELTAANKRMLWVPPGFAHGFLTITEVAEVFYKATDYYSPEHERSLLWSDPALQIPWPLDGDPIVAPKDASGMALKDAETFA